MAKDTKSTLEPEPSWVNKSHQSVTQFPDARASGWGALNGQIDYFLCVDLVSTDSQISVTVEKVTGVTVCRISCAILTIRSAAST